MATENITLLPYRERVKLVQERLRSLARPKPASLPKPARVIAAEKIVEAWQMKDEAHRDAQRSAHQAKRNEITDALIVGDMQKAVALIQAFGR